MCVVKLMKINNIGNHNYILFLIKYKNYLLFVG